MNHRFLAPGLILVGLCLLVVGTEWSRIVPSNAYWSNQEGEEYVQAQADLHAISHSHSHDADHERQVAAAKERFIKSYQALEYARQAQSRTGNFFTAGGIALLLLGIVVHMRPRHAG